MMKFFAKFETVINVTLLVMLATVDLGWLIIKDILSPPILLLDIAELLGLFGAFLLVMIGLELLGTIKTYITKNTIHVEVVLLVAIIAIARKVVILEPKELDGAGLLGIAAIILALTAGYYLVRLGRRRAPMPDGKPDA